MKNKFIIPVILSKSIPNFLLFQLAILAFFFFISSCKTYEEAGGIRWDRSFGSPGIFTQTFMVHHTNDTSLLVVKFIHEADVQEHLKSRKFLIINCYTGSGRGLKMADSLVKPFHLSIGANKDTTLLLPFYYLRNQHGNMLVRIISSDSTINSLHYIEIDKESMHNLSFFRVYSTDNKLLDPLFLRIIDTVHVSFFDKDVMDAKVYYFKPNNNPAAPTFSQYTSDGLPVHPDSVFNYSFNSKICFKQEGLYHFSITDDSVGLNILVSNPEFPYLQSLEEIISPLRYITTNDEFRHLLYSKTQKASLDSFWIARYTDTKVAKRMIRSYFNRVQFANKYFTNYRPGWMTDQGLVYILYGNPVRSYKFADNEIWVYNRRAQQSIEFTFMRKESIYGTYYELKRIPVYNNTMHEPNSYRDSWNEQSYKWRHGTILN
jgi:GWxTD domain-containing protein